MNGWTLIKERLDVVTLLLHDLKRQVSEKSYPRNPVPVTLHESKLLRKNVNGCSS